MSTPVKLILEHLDVVRDAFAQTTTQKAACERLASTCPALASMEVNTLRTRAPMVLEVADQLHKDCTTRLDEVTQERDAALAELAEVRQKVAQLEAKVVAQVTQQAVQEITQSTVQPPKHFEGWSVQVGKDGYTRLHKKIAGKVRSLYVGKGWNEAKARERIAGL